MLPITTDTATVPSIEEVLEIINGYLDALEVVLARTPRSFPGPACLLTRRAIRESERALEETTRARTSLAYAGNFARPVPMGSEWPRPVDLVTAALGRLRSASAALRQQRESAQPRNAEGLVDLGRWIDTTSSDLEALLGPMVELFEEV